MKKPSSIDDLMYPHKFKEWFDVVLSVPNGEFDSRFGADDGEVLVDGLRRSNITRGVEGPHGWAMERCGNKERMIFGVVIFKPEPRSWDALMKLQKFVRVEWPYAYIDKAERSQRFADKASGEDHSVSALWGWGPGELGPQLMTMQKINADDIVDLYQRRTAAGSDWYEPSTPDAYRRKWKELESKAMEMQCVPPTLHKVDDPFADPNFVPPAKEETKAWVDEALKSRGLSDDNNG